MKHLFLTGLSVLFCAFGPGATASPIEDPIHIVATLPDIADLAKVVGGDLVEVQAICKGTENVHAVRLKPSHVVMVSRCDLFFQVGLSLEHAWVPGLLKTSRNQKVQPGAPGLVTLSEGIEVLNPPASLSRREGADLHPEGNPHVNLARSAGRHMAARIRDALIPLRPDHKAELVKRYKEFESQSLAAEARWKELGTALKGRKVIVYHTEFTYLLKDLGLEVIATIEPKPGVPPTPGHLTEVIQAALAHPGVIVLTAAWSNNKAVDRVVEAGHSTKLVLASMAVSGQGWLDSMEALHAALAKAFDVPYGVDAPKPAPTETPKEKKS